MSTHTCQGEDGEGEEENGRSTGSQRTGFLGTQKAHSENIWK